MRMFAILLVGLVVASPVRVQAKEPDFALERYFAGRSQATGSFTALNGVSRRFTVTLSGSWNGTTLTLREDFVFNDGARDTKTWRFRKTGPGAYLGMREDVVGTVPVRIDGRKARFSYLVYIDAERKNLVRFHDLMVLGADGEVKNTALVTKFGFPVAWTKVAFRRSER